MKIHALVDEVDVVLLVLVVEVVEAKRELISYALYPHYGSNPSILLVVEVEPNDKISLQVSFS